MSFVRGIDVHPSYQTVTDWNAVAGAVDFLFQKATEHTTFRTPTTYYRTAKAHGLLVGAYHFFRPDRGATAQADWFVKWLRDAGWRKGFDLPPVLDLERTDGKSDTEIRASALAFMNRVEAQLGIRADDPWQRCVIYMNGDWRRRMGGTLTAGRVLWLAEWPTEFRGEWPLQDDDKPGGAGVWQFTDQMRIPGIRQNTDGDVALLAELKRMAPLFYNDGKEEDMPLTTAEINAVAKAVWDHRREVSENACELAGWPAGFDATAWNLLSGADAAEVKLLQLAAAEASRDALEAAAVAGVRAAVAEMDLGLSEAQLEQLAVRSSELTTLELIGAVSDPTP